MSFLKSCNPVILISCALTLTACGPVYRTNYELFPPADKAGQTCVNNVKLMSDTCEANCRQMARSCRSSGSGLSIGYGYGRFGGGYEAAMGNRQILDDRDCNDTACIDSCLATARQAHLNCGGTIKSEVVCTANCPTTPAIPAR